MTDVAANKALIAAFMDALNHKDWEAVQRLCSPAYVHHAPRVSAADLSTYIETAGRLFHAFPDMVATVDQMRVSGIQRVVDGQIAEGWFEFDTGEIYSQLREVGASGKGEA